MKRKGSGRSMILFILFAIALCVFFVRVLEARSLFAPYRDVLQTPKDLGLDFEAVTLVTSDNVKLTGWFVPGEKNDRVLYFLHGNAGNISHRLGKVKLFHELGWSVFIMDYRGYGNSTGFPSEKGLYRDARAGYDYLLNVRHFEPKNIVVEGESLGGAVAVDLAHRVPVGALILVGTFTSVADMGRVLYPAIPSFIVVSKFDSLSKMSGLRCPILFIHSRNDEIVPFDMGRRLYEAFNGDKEFVATTGGHNDHFLIHEARLKESLKTYLSRVAG